MVSILHLFLRFPIRFGNCSFILRFCCTFCFTFEHYYGEIKFIIPSLHLLDRIISLREEVLDHDLAEPRHFSFKCLYQATKVGGQFYSCNLLMLQLILQQHLPMLSIITCYLLKCRLLIYPRQYHISTYTIWYLLTCRRN